MTFGDKLSALRREQNYTQEQLADLLGVSRQSVSKWESGAAYPETEKLIRLSTLFNCSLDYLLRDAPRETAAAPTAPQQAEAAPDAAGGRFVVTVPYPCYERKSRRQLFGMPLYHVNIGPGRVAKGFFAVGLIARGVVSVGLISIGFISVGLISIGLLALGLD
ncbi:MAG: helix-turn-helix domain-containing protein, partial [Acutalibacteraceae bacterium]|nr:helix-turn-helix domain-containing protein [Acutalibacteraceae bacterium]